MLGSLARSSIMVQLQNQQPVGLRGAISRSLCYLRPVLLIARAMDTGKAVESRLGSGRDASRACQSASSFQVPP